MRLLKFVLSITLLSICFTNSVKAQSPANGSEVVRLMHQTQSDNWYRHITFKQDMFWYRHDSLIKNEIWVVAYSTPSMLHIRYKDFDSGRGWIFTNDTLFTFNHNKLIGQRPRMHSHLALGFDVYVVDPEVMIPRIEQMGFDLHEISEVEINGNSVYQIGNSKEHCFWVHKESMLFYGVRKVDESGVKDTFFKKYKMFYGKPVATELHNYQDGSLYLFEKYFEIRLPNIFPDSYFNPEEFENTRW